VWYAQEVLHLSKKVLSHTTKGCWGNGASARFHLYAQIYLLGIACTWTPKLNRGSRTVIPQLSYYSSFTSWYNLGCASYWTGSL